MKGTKSARHMVSSPQLKHVNFEDKFYKCSWLTLVRCLAMPNQTQVMKQSDVFIYIMSELW